MTLFQKCLNLKNKHHFNPLRTEKPNFLKRTMQDVKFFSFYSFAYEIRPKYQKIRNIFFKRLLKLMQHSVANSSLQYGFFEIFVEKVDFENFSALFYQSSISTVFPIVRFPFAPTSVLFEDSLYLRPFGMTGCSPTLVAQGF